MTTSRLPRVFRLLALAALAFAALALRAAEPVAFDIPAQPAPAALKLFTKQSGAQVVYIQDELASVTTQSIKGEFTPAEALSRLLEGTGFTAEPTGNGNFTIARKGNAKPGSIEGSVQSESGRPVAVARVSLVGSNQTVVTDKRGHFYFEEVPAGPQSLAITAEGMQSTKVTDVNVKAGHRLTLSTISIPAAVAGAVQLEDYVVSAKKNDAVVELAAYDVYGERARPFAASNIDLTRTETDVLPFQVFTAIDIERSGAGDLSEFFRTRMTQNMASSISEQSVNNGIQAGLPGGASLTASAISLANGAGSAGQLGAGELVILVNGRRLPSRAFGADNVAANSADIRALPIGAIERIEYLTSAGSAIYGVGATGGVINIVTKKNFEGGLIFLNFETPVDAYAPRMAAEFSYSKILKWGINFRLAGSRSRTTPLMLGDRGYLRDRYYAKLMERNPARLTGSAVPPLGATPNIRGNSGVSLFGPGTSVFTSVPDGYAGGAGRAPFDQRQGIYNLDLAEGRSGIPGFGKSSWLGNKIEYSSLSFGFDKTIWNAWILDIEYRRDESDTIAPGGVITNDQAAPTQVPANALHNPFGQAVRVAYFDPRLLRPELRNSFSSESDAMTVSLRGSYSDWHAVVDFNFRLDKDDAALVAFRAPTGGWAAAYVSGRYNPFVDMRTAAPALPDFYNDYIQDRVFSGGEMYNYQATAKASGPVLGLTTGPVLLTAGLEWYRQARGDMYQLSQQVNSITQQPVAPWTVRDNRLSDFSNTSQAIYSELTIPLIGEEGRMAMLYDLEVFASGQVSQQRVDGYRVTTSVTQPGPNYSQFQTVGGYPFKYVTRPHVYAFGFKYEPIRGIMIRSSHSIGFKAPGVGDITPLVQSGGNIDANDVKRGVPIVITPDMRLLGGNPDVMPESTVSTNIGIVISLEQLPGFKAFIDIVDNKRDNAITSLTPQLVLNLEESDPRMAARVQRDASGIVTFIDARSTNFNQVTSRTVDVRLQQSTKNCFGGTLTISAAATKAISFKIQSSADTPPAEQVRNPNSSFFPVKWNGNAQISWAGDRWIFGWNGRFNDSVLVRPARLIEQDGDRIASAWDHDAFATYRTTSNRESWLSALLANTSITVGVKNILNRKARYSADNLSLGYYGGDSIMGRSVWVQVRKHF